MSYIITTRNLKPVTGYGFDARLIEDVCIKKQIEFIKQYDSSRYYEILKAAGITEDSRAFDVWVQNTPYVLDFSRIFADIITKNEPITVTYNITEFNEPIIIYESHPMAETGWIKDIFLKYLKDLYIYPDGLWFYNYYLVNVFHNKEEN